MNTVGESGVLCLLWGIALCHNVTPVFEDEAGETCNETGADVTVTYQASSPDEVGVWRHLLARRVLL